MSVIYRNTKKVQKKYNIEIFCQVDSLLLLVDALRTDDSNNKQFYVPSRNNKKYLLTFPCIFIILQWFSRLMPAAHNVIFRPANLPISCQQQMIQCNITLFSNGLCAMICIPSSKRTQMIVYDSWVVWNSTFILKYFYVKAMCIISYKLYFSRKWVQKTNSQCMRCSLK